MGAHESTEAHVNFNRPSLVYFADEQITGNISYHNAHDKLILHEICLEFIGELGFATEEIHQHFDDDENIETEHYKKNHVIPFIHIRIPVVQPGNGEREIILNNGQHLWPFEFILSKQLPPSLTPSTTSHPFIKYYTRIFVDKPQYKPDTKQIYPLTIFPRVNLLQISGSQQQVPFSSMNRKTVQLDGYLLRGGIIPSEKLSIYINLQNPKQSTIKRIEAVLIQHRQVDQSHHEEIIFREDLPDLHEFSGTKFERTVDLVVPCPHFAPSYQFTAQLNHQTHPVSIRYELELKVKSHGLLTDFEVKLPIIIGTESVLDQQQTNNSAKVPTVNASASDYNESPPSYGTVVSNETM